MWLFNVRDNDRGFTLLEMIVVVLLIGIISAIATPSILSSLERNKLDTALNYLRGSLEESQREAMRKSRSCPVTINPTNRTITGDCLITGSRTLDSGITILPNSNTTITFSFKGNTTNNATIVLYMSGNANSQEKRCLAISEGVGILRTGIYSGSTSFINESNCSAKL
ncbi:pilus assembly FimT family protein [Merismopedia glauca]|uniref:Type II secretion system protein n=1 Tax=Merismopedia glauca CCAP 1448/3 TaxID=1296344 RepID=A0A2T1C6Y7_9CYAN|nr:prepilin-type N-terminal cleavage/methylation domain-containing protein [Merismopedia glauca]PSB04042.1 type II secretion system protein [Merismopedia glauca CCAP 1448/3]